MDLATLDITPEEATKRLADIEALIAAQRTVEDDAIAAGYRAAKRGLPVISLSQTMAQAGWFPNGLPRFAICRADARQCWVDVRHWGNPWQVTFADREWDRGRAQVGAYRVSIDMPPPTSATANPQRWARTIVPYIPAQYRPKRGRLGRFHVLWEVDRWTLTPPHDPVLVRHIRGDLWAVLAAWDLTDLERAVLAGRATD